MSVDLFHQTSCILLSAGSSQRMGEHKALLKYSVQTTFIEHITETYLQAGINEVIVVVNKELYKRIEEVKLVFPHKVSLVINKNPKLGRFYSLQTGIQQHRKESYCFFQNIDNPFTSENLLRELIFYKEEADLIVPVFQNKSGHPVLINPAVVQKIMTIRNSEIRIDEFLRTFRTRKVEFPDHRILSNINSQEDYLEAGF